MGCLWRVSFVFNLLQWAVNLYIISHRSKATVNHIANTLSVEEPDVTTIAIRPGVVDTEMQNLIRSEGEQGMKEDHVKFIELHRTGNLVQPQDPGHVLVALANNPPKELSGQMYSWNDEEMKPFNRS